MLEILEAIDGPSLVIGILIGGFFAIGTLLFSGRD